MAKSGIRWNNKTKRPYFCNGKRKDGKPCGNRVQTPRSYCWVHGGQ